MGCLLLGESRGHGVSGRPALRMRSSVVAMSFLRNDAKLAGSPAAGVAPCSASASTTSGAARALVVSALILAITAAGVPAGAKIPYQTRDSSPGTPASALVGISLKS